MKIIPPPSIDSLEVFTNIASRKIDATKKRLMDNYKYVESRYAEYSTHKKELALISPKSLGVDIDEALLNCYLSETNELQKMKAEIKSNHYSSVGMKCQFCGVDNISTFDHYLPKESFPDFSVHPLNLIPCCSTCNNKKRSVFLTDVGERAIINLYFESLPTERYLFSKIKYENKTPVASFFLGKPPSYSERQFRLVVEHYSRLNLLDRYRENSPEVFSETQASIIIQGYATSNELVKDWLRKEAEKYSTLYSANNWKVPLFVAMAECDEYVSSCL